MQSSKYGIIEQRIKAKLRRRLTPLVDTMIDVYRAENIPRIRQWLEQGFNDEAINTMLENALAGQSNAALDSLQTFLRELNIVMSTEVDAMYRAEKGWTDNTPLQWVGVSDDRTCDDCEPRIGAGEIKTLKEWEAEGVPRSGWSVCGENCRCDLAEP